MNYLSIDQKRLRAIAVEEFLTLEFRRAWIIFSAYCAGEIGCEDTPKAVAKAAMISLAEAEQFRAEIADLVEARDGIIAPFEIWRAIDRAAKKSKQASESVSQRWRYRRNTNVSLGDTFVSVNDTDVIRSYPERVLSECEGEGEGEVNVNVNQHYRADAREEETLSDALIAVFPQLDSLSRFAQTDLREITQYCIRLRASPQQIRDWPAWLLRKWPQANASPKKFHETFHQFLHPEISNGIHQQPARTESAEERRLRELAEDLGIVAPPEGDYIAG